MSTNADIVNGWFADRLANGPIARNTEAYNQAQSALTDLITRLDAATAPAPADAAATPATPSKPTAAQKAAAKIAADAATLAADEAAVAQDTASATTDPASE